MIDRARRRFSNRRLAVTAGLAALSLCVVALIAFRVAYTHAVTHADITWNLFLAWVPFVISLAVYDRARRGDSKTKLAPAAAIWLLFLPNAPYIVTDLRHIRGNAGVPGLYDALLLAGAGATGLLLGLVSLLLMHDVARRLVGAAAAWSGVAVVIVLSSFGVYVGRVERWNSWDVFVRPESLLGQLARAAVDPLAHPKPLALMFVFACFLSACYLAFYAFARSSSLLSD
jgi:uncharacterized membrane protein